MPIGPEWKNRLAADIVPDDVVQTARAFVASRPGKTWRRLPRELRPGPMDRAEDVTAYALLLMQREFTLSGEAASDFYEVLEFFAAATQRLARLGAGRFSRS